MPPGTASGWPRCCSMLMTGGAAMRPGFNERDELCFASRWRTGCGITCAGSLNRFATAVAQGMSTCFPNNARTGSAGWRRAAGRASAGAEVFGGRNCSIEQQVIFSEEYARVGGPGRMGPYWRGAGRADPDRLRQSRAAADLFAWHPAGYRVSGVRGIPSRGPVPIWPESVPGRASIRRPASGLSTVRRYGHRWRRSPTGAFCWRAPTPIPRRTKGWGVSWWR